MSASKITRLKTVKATTNGANLCRLRQAALRVKRGCLKKTINLSALGCARGQPVSYDGP